MNQPDERRIAELERLAYEEIDTYEQIEKKPQVRLTRAEIDAVPIGNQFARDRPTLIEWQVVKGAAKFYEVSDWLSKIDRTLTMDENVALMAAAGIHNNRTTMREMASI